MDSAGDPPLIPLVWTTIASVSPHGATAQQVGYGFGNYRTLMDYDAGLPQYLWNSTFVSVLTVIFTLALSILGGYAFGRFRFPGRDVLFLLIIAILMVPYATLLVPLWVMFGEIGLRNSLVGLALVLTLYGALVVFGLGALLPVALLARIPVLRFLRHVRAPALIAFSPTSSDAALPLAMERM